MRASIHFLDYIYLFPLFPPQNNLLLFFFSFTHRINEPPISSSKIFLQTPPTTGLSASPTVQNVSELGGKIIK
ncbi:unnamed protein product [Meloidogyne enterolobii]|uniref:Uncharacterized protein n=1 Tax=Meloidogyne enterolobii TaxID=390850 RepID=A0ACB0YRL7_MELEN